MNVASLGSGSILSRWPAPPAKTPPPAEKSAVETAAQEAQETLDVTKAEAAKGDQQAIQRLAAQDAAKNQSSHGLSLPKVHQYSLDVTA